MPLEGCEYNKKKNQQAAASEDKDPPQKGSANIQTTIILYVGTSGHKVLIT